MENDLYRYWRTSRDIREFAAMGLRSSNDLKFAVVDLDIISMHTKWARMRRACAQNLASLNASSNGEQRAALA